MTMRHKVLGLVLLLSLTAAVFAPIAQHEFVGLDDPEYVTKNPMVARGLTPVSVSWAFTSFRAANWHPLTWLSHMLDVELFGLRPGGHHLMSLLLHGMAAAVLFFFLAAITGAPAPSLWVALCFAIHPLRVESVAWAAERKDVLAALFWMLALAAYLWYLRRPRGARLVLLTLVFALGLLAKPMLVTLPLILLTLDYWPLGRLRHGQDFPRLLVEKAPLLFLAAISSVVTVKAQGASVVSLHVFPAGERISGAAVAAVAYLGKTLWPASLSVHYPRPPGGPGLAITIASLLLLLLACAAAVRLARRLPFLVTGGGWYVVALMPVIGLIQVGDQAMADRYTYLPSIGLFLAGIWLLRDLARTRPRLRTALVVAGCITLCSWSVATSRHLRVWANSGTLFTHSLRVAPESWLIHFVYGTVLRDGGEAGKAIEEFQQAASLRPRSAETHFNLGLAYDDRGEAARAVQAYREALRLKPDYAEAHNNLGAVYGREGDFDGAVEHFRAAVSLQPDLPGTRQNLARALLRQAQSVAAPR